MITVGVIDDGIEFSNDLDIKKSIEINSHSNIREITALEKVNSKHGTICAYIIKKYYPKVVFNSIKVLDSRMVCKKEQLIIAIEWCIKNNVKIINMSLGSSSYGEFKDIKEEIKKAYEKGIIVIAAYNNRNILTYPASDVNVIGVKSSEKLKEGEYIFNLYPLDNIEITSCGEHNLSYIDMKNRCSNSYAAPMITAKVCEIVEKNNNITLEEVKQKLYKNAINYKDNICINNNYTNSYEEREKVFNGIYKKRKIDIPLIAIVNEKVEYTVDILKELTKKFRSDKYYVLSVCTDLVENFEFVEYVPLKDELQEFRDRIEGLYYIYDYDIIILGISKKDYLNILKKINNTLNPDIFIFSDEECLKYKNEFIRHLDAEESFVINYKDNYKKENISNTFKRNELELFYKYLLKLLINE